MGKFVYAYRGGGVPESEEQQQAVMAAWGAWYRELGQAVVDGGNPFGASAAVGDGRTSGLTGYTIVSAGSLDEATTMAKGCPVLADGGTVEVYEAFDVM